MPSLTNAVYPPFSCRVVYAGFAGVLDGMRMAGVGDGRGNLRVAKTPPLQSALRGGRCDAYGIDHHLRPHGHQRELREGEIAMRRFM